MRPILHTHGIHVPSLTFPVVTLKPRECIVTRSEKHPSKSDQKENMATNDSQFPISSNSRTKLNAFRYKDQAGASDEVVAKDGKKAMHTDKENQTSWLNGVVEPIQTSLDKLENPRRTESANEPKPVKECPHTPGNRIPLADLISNAEDAFAPAPGPEVTPVDHVIWQHIPVSSNPDTSSQTPAGRRKKRRHGSSSPSSPTNGNKKKAQKEPLDLQSIQALFKTPQHDLAAELWNNYMDKNMVDGSEDLPAPRLANLLSSSPQTPVSGRTSRDSSGLRRSISCAAEWPTSRAKRRRTNRYDPGSGRSIFSRANSNVLDSGKTKSSRLNFLLEKIEKSLQPPPVAEMGPPGSSPLRQRLDARRCRSSSPITEKMNTIDTEAAAQPLKPSASNAKATRNATLQDSSSDFGDDDLDLEFMDLASASADPFVDPAASCNEFESFGSSAWSNLATGKLQSSHPMQPAPADEKPSIVHDIMNGETKPDDSDDFEDDFGDLSEDFEEMLAKCDGKSGNVNSAEENPTAQQNPGKAGSATAASKVETDFSDDEFDDDIDLESLEQTMKQAGEKETYVCHS